MTITKLSVFQNSKVFFSRTLVKLVVTSFIKKVNSQASLHQVLLEMRHQPEIGNTPHIPQLIRNNIKIHTFLAIVEQKKHQVFRLFLVFELVQTV